MSRDRNHDDESHRDQLFQRIEAADRRIATLESELQSRPNSALAEWSQTVTFDHIRDSVVTVDVDGIVTRVNESAAKLLDTVAEAVSGRHYSDILDVRNAVSGIATVRDVDRVLADGEIVELADPQVLTSSTGTKRRVELSSAPIRDLEGKIHGAVVILCDKTDELALQEQILLAQKMDAIGRLAGGVAHDFNNILTGIMGNAQLLAMRLEETTVEASCATEILNASDRAADLTRQLLAFSQRGQLQTVDLDIHDLIRESSQLLSGGVDRLIEIKLDLEADPATVHGDPTQLRNALLNLAFNAREAMPDGGEITISTRTVVLDTPHLVLDTESEPNQGSPRAYLELAVTDTGVGIDHESQKRIFEPFYTTKDPGTGTGLGLAGVYGCARSHEGLLRVYSEVGSGTTMKILLPLVESAETEAKISNRGTLVRGRGRILLIDDEETIRKASVRALRELGYSAVTASDGLEGIEVFRRHKGGFDLVILDLIMPRLGGEDTFRLLREMDPDLKVLISSGFSVGRVTNALLQDGAVGFLNKPFQIEELSAEIARHLGTSVLRRKAS